MNDDKSESSEIGLPVATDSQYVVVARRYRPQTFGELIGQEHVAKALSAAIAAARVGHAYLFTGARGVGKTSAARILAKALCCVNGPTPTPCNQCDICQSIMSGGDVDVLEIDGASNRGIEEIRQLRSNVGIRPSRTRFKIYIIDEVHMLTREAFNALLKTLEEPPEHVKFIFCTTEPTKIPVTVLSRCQRFDFAGIQSASIAARLGEIVSREGLSAEPEALAILARRAGGSMRDSQSLLEQLLAFGGEHISVADVHAMLGTADNQRLMKLAEHIARNEPAGALAELETALAEGVDVGELLEQLLGILRDAMAALAGCGRDALLHVTSSDEQQAVSELGAAIGLERLLAMLQIVEETLSRLRYSTHRRTLAEVALVRLSRLENLDELVALAAGLGGTPAAAGASRPPSATAGAPVTSPPGKKKSPSAGDISADDATVRPTAEPVSVEPANEITAAPANALTDETAEIVWKEALALLPEAISAKARKYHSATAVAPDCLEVAFPEAYNFGKTACEQPERLVQIERALAQAAGGRVRVNFTLVAGTSAARPGAETPRPAPSAHQKLRAAHENPIVRRSAELFKARVADVD